ncbi:M20 peptidase aminoacylase family protein [Lysinibacillus sp. 54212]|uniref:M20 peptidase aminoacylase family protein n=1 Tax=Lysinibacillus sp. 54212 TaxID=3119829 RepID=UPI002FC904AC
MKQALQGLELQIQSIFHYLHNHPEISWHEYETTKYIYKLLQLEGFKPILFKDCTGLYVDVGEGTPVVGLRADMDALWQEVDGQMKANHSCGHDGHMTMAIGVLLLLKHIPAFEGTIRVIFQPAEEKGAGALKVLEQGVIDPLTYLFGVHVRPIQEIADGNYSPAIFHGAAMAFEGEIIGEDAHAARPHLGQNAIEVGWAIVQMLASIHHDPLIPASYKLTKFQAGGDASNIIPGKALFSIDIRAQRNDVMYKLCEQIKERIGQIASLYKVHIELKESVNIVGAEVDNEAMCIMKDAIVDSVGEACLAQAIHTPGGEDFHYYAVKRPSVKTAMLGLGCGVTPGLHHPHMTFNEERLLTGIEILTRAVLSGLQNAKTKEVNEYARINSGEKIRNN